MGIVNLGLSKVHALYVTQKLRTPVGGLLVGENARAVFCSQSITVINHNASKRFCFHRVRQGYPISPFLFILVVELMSVSILNNTLMQGISIFNKEIRISQLADDTTPFLKDKDQIPFALKSIKYFS